MTVASGFEFRCTIGSDDVDHSVSNGFDQSCALFFAAKRGALAIMNASNMNQPSQTDWERIDKLTDEDIDTSDIPPLDVWFFAKARLRMPRTQLPVTMHIDADLPD